jgi:hypothetical protein
MIIGLPRTEDHMQNVCGFCGNFNDDKSDDWIVGPYQPCAGGSTPGAVVSFYLFI